MAMLQIYDLRELTPCS